MRNLGPGELEALMVRYQQADSAAIDAFVASLSRPIFQYFVYQVRDRSQAEDLLQDFWLRIHKARHTYRPGEPVLPWAYAIARRTRVDQYRKYRRIRNNEIPSDRLPELSAPEAPSSGLPDLAELLSTLPQSQREIVVMLKVSGLSLEEAARVLGTTVGSVKQKAHRAYEKIRRLIGETP